MLMFLSNLVLVCNHWDKFDIAILLSQWPKLEVVSRCWFPLQEASKAASQPWDDTNCSPLQIWQQISHKHIGLLEQTNTLNIFYELFGNKLSLEWMVKFFDSQTVWCNLRFLFWNKYKWNKLKAHLHIYSILAGCGWEHQARKGKHKGSELLPSPPFSEAKLWLHLKHKD